MEGKNKSITLRLGNGQPKAEYVKIDYGRSFVNFINEKSYRDKGITKTNNWKKKWCAVVNPKDSNIAGLYSCTFSFHIPVSFEGIQGLKLYILYLFLDSRILEIRGGKVKIMSRQEKQGLVEWAVQERQKMKEEINNIGYA